MYVRQKNLNLNLVSHAVSDFSRWNLQTETVTEEQRIINKLLLKSTSNPELEVWKEPKKKQRDFRLFCGLMGVALYIVMRLILTTATICAHLLYLSIIKPCFLSNWFIYSIDNVENTNIGILLCECEWREEWASSLSCMSENAMKQNTTTKLNKNIITQKLKRLHASPKLA